MKWEEVLSRDDIIGGDIETHEDGDVYRGPLSGIKLEGGHVHFQSPWVARKSRSIGEVSWKSMVVHPFFINARFCPPRKVGNQIHFNLPSHGLGVIFLKGDSKLNPRRVEGLKILEPTT